MATVNGTSGNDFIHMAGDGATVPVGANEVTGITTGQDIVDGGGGFDIVYMGGNLDPGDRIDAERVELFGDYDSHRVFTPGGVTVVSDALVLQPQTLSHNVVALVLDGGTLSGQFGYHVGYNITLAAGSSLLFVDGSSLDSGNPLILDASLLDNNSQLSVHAGNGHNDLTSGAGFNAFGFDSTANLANSVVDGGEGISTLVTFADSDGATVNLSGAVLKNVTSLHFGGLNSVVAVTDDALVASGKMLSVDSSTLGGALVFNVAAETDGNFTIQAGVGNDSLTGGAGNDHLSGGGGFDTLIGGPGDDDLDGGANPSNQGDIMLGGAGNDTYHVDSALDLVDEGFVFPDAGWGGIDTIFSTANWYWDVESVGEVDKIEENASDPSHAGVTFVGGIFDNTLIGHSGTDILFGRGGNDTYMPGDGIDWISLSTLGLTDDNAYVGVNGHNTIVATPRTSGAVSYDIIFEFEPGKDQVAVWPYGNQYASGADVLSHAVDDGAGNSYIPLGDGFDYIFFVGLTKDHLLASDFTV